MGFWIGLFALFALLGAIVYGTEKVEQRRAAECERRGGVYVDVSGRRHGTCFQKGIVIQ